MSVPPRRTNWAEGRGGGGSGEFGVSRIDGESGGEVRLTPVSEESGKGRDGQKISIETKEEE